METIQNILTVLFGFGILIWLFWVMFIKLPPTKNEKLISSLNWLDFNGLKIYRINGRPNDQYWYESKVEEYANKPEDDLLKLLMVQSDTYEYLCLKRSDTERIDTKSLIETLKEEVIKEAAERKRTQKERTKELVLLRKEDKQKREAIIAERKKLGLEY